MSQIDNKMSTSVTFLQLSLKSSAETMIGGRAKQTLKNAKPIAKYKSQASNSIPAPPQPPPTH